MTSTSQPKLSLTYFPIGGRAEPIRMCFAIGKIPFTNISVSFKEFVSEVKAKLPLGQMPVLEIDSGNDGGKTTITQTTSILRYIGKQAGLYPKDDDVKAMEIDEILSVLDDLRSPLGLTIMGAKKCLLSDDKEFTDEEKMAIRRRWTEQTIPKYVGFLEKKIEDNKGSDWIVGGSMTIADLVLYCDLSWVSGGVLDGVPQSVLDAYPACRKLMEKVKNDEGVKRWTDNYCKPYETFDYEP